MEILFFSLFFWWVPIKIHHFSMIYLVPSLNLAKTELFAAPQDLFPQINLLLNSVYNLQQTEVSNASFTLFKHFHFIFTYYYYCCCCCCYFGDFWSCFAEGIRIVLSMSTIYIFQNCKISSWKSVKKSPNLRFKPNLVFEILQKIKGGPCFPTSIWIPRLVICSSL